MNKVWIKLFFSALAILCFLSCKNQNAKDNSGFREPELKSITEKINKDPKNAALYFERGGVLHQFSKDSLVLNDYKTAVSLDSSRAEYYSAIGDLLFEHKDISGSVPWLKKAIELNPQDPKAHLKIAKMFLYMQQYKEAVAEINFVLHQNINNPEPYFLLGMIYKDMKDTTKAIASFTTAVDKFPEHKPSIIQLGQLYAAKKNPIALKYYDNAFKLDTSDVFPLFAKGIYYQGVNDLENAKQEYKNCILHDSHYADAYFNTGWILIQQDSFTKAMRQYDLVTKIAPTNAGAYYNRGLCSELMNNKQDAINDYKQALIFNSKYAEASEGLKRLGVK